MECSICGNTIEPMLHPATGEVVWDQGNNAEPINDGRCCDVCDGLVVIPRRIQMVMQGNGWTQADTSTEQTNSD
jgi:hypothetical protein